MQLLRDGKAKDRASAKEVLAAMSSVEVARYLRGLTAQQLIAPFKATKPGFGMYRAPALLRDGHVLPTSTVVEALAQPTVPLLLGTNRDELKLFMLGNPQYVTRSIGLHINDEPSFERDARLGADVWKALGTDLPAAAAQQTGTPVFAYRFDWDEEPSYLAADLPKLLGAAHGLEIGFVFDDEAGEFDPFKINTKDNEPGRVKLARAMASYWVQFARTGAPGRGVDGTLPEWTGYGPDARFMVLDTDTGGGPHMDRGPMQLDALEQRVWDDKTFDDAGRCAAIKAMFQGFGAASGVWTAERAARFAAKCR
jgi:para-nitrobenzyl esterase